MTLTQGAELSVFHLVSLVGVKTGKTSSQFVVTRCRFEYCSYARPAGNAPLALSRAGVMMTLSPLRLSSPVSVMTLFHAHART